MTRRKLRPDVEAQVLLRSRRRCALCFGLSRDTDLKPGQIAHLDQNSANDALDNLVFLCFAHHDEYDSRTSQRKGITSAELSRYRAELDEALANFLTASLRFGSLDVANADPIAGTYLRTSGNEKSAELSVQRIGPSRVRITGLALWGTHREYGPNIGELECEVDVVDNAAYYDLSGRDVQYSADFHFTNSGLIVRERHSRGLFGLNVSFDGAYRRVM